MSGKTVFDHLREHLHQRLTIDPLPPAADPGEWMATEWNHDFERLCRDRMFMGALRYGRLGAPGKPRYDRCADVIRRIQCYMAGGNTEYLVDAANLCQCEFVEGDHPRKHFAAGDDAPHTAVKGGWR